MKNIKILIVFLFLLLFTSGCWNYQELNDYAIITGISIDKKDGQYKVSALISNGKKVDESQTQINVISGEGITIFNALKDASLKSPKELYISHLSVVLLSEEVAKDGVSDIFDYLLRDPQSHQNFFVLVVKDKPAIEGLTILSPLSDYPSQNITMMIETSQKLQGRIANDNFNSIIKNFVEPGINIMMNSIVIEGNAEEGKSQENQQNSIANAAPKLDSLALFKGNKFVGWATQKESVGINLLMGNISYFYVNTPCNNGYAVTVSDNYKINYKVEKKKITINAQAEGYITEVNCDINLQKVEEIKKLEKETIKEMKKYMDLAIAKAKQLETDVFGFGSMINKKFPNYFKSIKDWDKAFLELEFDINIEFQYRGKGTLGNSLEGFIN